MSERVVTEYRQKPVVVKAMQFAGTTPDLHDVYCWVEELVGSFDVNHIAVYPEVPEVHTRGVSIDAGTGQMVIATVYGIIPVREGDWVVCFEDDRLSVWPEASFEHSFELAHGVRWRDYDNTPNIEKGDSLS